MAVDFGVRGTSGTDPYVAHLFLQQQQQSSNAQSGFGCAEAGVTTGQAPSGYIAPLLLRGTIVNRTKYC